MPDWGLEPRERWAWDQLAKLQLPDSVNSPVIQLLNCYWNAHFPVDKTEQILTLFNELARNHSLDVPDERYDWVPAKPGQIKVTDVVRVRADAYQGGIGQEHNGRVGKIVAIRSGDVIINTIDDGPKQEGVHHSPFALEKRVLVP